MGESAGAVGECEFAIEGAGECDVYVLDAGGLD
jgi:hypothetical protein